MEGTVTYTLTCPYSGPRYLPDGHFYGADFLDRKFSVFEQFSAASVEEAESLRGQAANILKARARATELNLNLLLPDFYKVEDGALSSSIVLPDGRRPISAMLCHRVSSGGPQLSASELNADSIVSAELIRQDRTLKAMTDLYLAGKKLGEQHGRMALLCFHQVLEARAWKERRDHTDASVPDHKVGTKGRDVVEVWERYGLGAAFVLVGPHVQQNIDIAHPIPNEHPVLSAIRIARNKRQIGHGIPEDPLPSVRLPISEAEQAARLLIARYSEDLVKF